MSMSRRLVCVALILVCVCIAAASADSVALALSAPKSFTSRTAVIDRNLRSLGRALASRQAGDRTTLRVVRLKRRVIRLSRSTLAYDASSYRTGVSNILGAKMVRLNRRLLRLQLKGQKIHAGHSGRTSAGSQTIRRLRSKTRRWLVRWQEYQASPCEYGVHMDMTWDADPSRRASEVAAVRNVLHAQISRNSLLWHQVEMVQGQRDWSLTDAVVNELTSAGIEPMFTVIGSPSWANGVTESVPDHQLYVPTDTREFHTWLGHFTEFLTAAVIRYGDRVPKWEIWGEENDSFCWKPAENQLQYNETYVAARAAIKAVDPSAQVAIGGLSGLEACGGITGKDFLQGMYDAGIFPDYVAIHPYTTGPAHAPDTYVPWENNFGDIQAIRDIQVANHSVVPMWLTEWGWSLDDTSEASQADFLLKSLRMIRGEFKYVTVATVFMDYDHYGFRYGLLRSDLTPRASGTAFGAFVRGVD